MRLEVMVSKFLIVAVALGCLMAAGNRADAADLSLAPLYKAPPATPDYNWSGFYLGANGGGGWGRSHWTTAGHADTSGGLAGGTVGYNWQAGKTVLGLEGDLDWSGLKGTANSTLCPFGCTTSDSWLSTVRGRIGYSFNRVMPYVTGGLAVGDIKASTPGLPGGSSTNAGWTVGGGLEFALPGNWTAKAEYLHVDLGQFDCGTNCGGTPTDKVSSRADIFRAGVNYRFGWGK
jgi:outer membrane immunogenic protein